jgi:hypothetical protein
MFDPGAPHLVQTIRKHDRDKSSSAQENMLVFTVTRQDQSHSGEYPSGDFVSGREKSTHLVGLI